MVLLLMLKLPSLATILEREIFNVGKSSKIIVDFFEKIIQQKNKSNNIFI